MKPFHYKLLSSLTLLFVYSNSFQVSAQEFYPFEVPEEEKIANIALGERFDSSWELYQHFYNEADGGQKLQWDKLPDWSGLFTVMGNIFTFDHTQVPEDFPSAKLTPEYHQKALDKRNNVNSGVEYDPISACGPPGHPRWLTEPFLKEFIITPDQTWLINEMVNDIRRIYTDGREHTPEDEAYPMYNGDSIGFWDGDKLVIHTKYLSSGQYQRGQPDYTEQVQTVEIWQIDNEKNVLSADVWIFDPPALAEPWYTKHQFARLTNDDKALRIRYWHCQENQNNVVEETEEGTSQFKDFTFTDEDD